MKTDQNFISLNLHVKETLNCVLQQRKKKSKNSLTRINIHSCKNKSRICFFSTFIEFRTGAG